MNHGRHLYRERGRRQPESSSFTPRLAGQPSWEQGTSWLVFVYRPFLRAALIEFSVRPEPTPTGVVTTEKGLPGFVGPRE